MKNEKEYNLYKDSIFIDNAMTVVIFCVVFIMSVINFILYLNTKLNYDSGIKISTTFYPISSIFLFISIVLIIVGMFILFFINNNISKRKFFIYENKIETTYKSKPETEIHFKDIKEVYTFRQITKDIQYPFGVINCLAYRKSLQDIWIVIKPTLQNGFKKNQGIQLINSVQKKYVKYKLDDCKNELQNGKILKFEYLSGANNIIRNEFDKNLYLLAKKSLNIKSDKTKNYNNSNDQNIILEKDGIIFKDFKMTFDNSDELIFKSHEVTWPVNVKTDYPLGEYLIIQDINGNPKLEIDLVCLINSDLFVALLKSFYEDSSAQLNETTNILDFEYVEPAEIPDNAQIEFAELIIDDVIEKLPKQIKINNITTDYDNVELIEANTMNDEEI